MPDNKEIQLNEQDRIKLDSIVKKMISNKEPDANIKFVVEDFKKLYGKKLDSVKEQPKEQSKQLKEKPVDFGPLVPQDKLVSESTRTKFTPQLKKPEGLVVKSFEEEEAKRNKGKRVAAEKIAKSKYGNPTESQIQSELKIVQQKAKDKQLVPYTNKDGSIDYRQEAGFFEGALNGINKALINTEFGILKLLTPSENHALLNQSQELKLKESELDPLQSFGSILSQTNPVQAVSKIMPYGDVEQAYKSRQGLDVSYEGAAPVAGELVSTIGMYGLMPQGAIAKASSVAAFSYLQNYSQTTNQLFNELKDKGLSDEDAGKQSKIDGLTQALPKTALDIYFFGRTPVKAPNQAALNLFQTIGHVAKQSAKFGALSGAEVAATDGIRNLQNIFQKREYNTDDTEGKVFDAVVHGAAMGVVMESIPHILRLPKVAKSAIFDYATKDIVKPIITEALKNLPENISVPFAEGMKRFEEANKGIADIVPEDKSHVVGGITTRIKVIEGEIEKLNEQKKSVPESLHENIDKKIADLEQEKKEANQRITTALNSENPLEVEYDEVGNKIAGEQSKAGSVDVIDNPALKDVKSTAKALEEKINPEYKNSIVEKLSFFDEQIKNKKFPNVLEVAEKTLPKNIFNKYKSLYELGARNNITVSNEAPPSGFVATWAFDNIQLDKNSSKYYLKDYNEFADTLNHEIIHGLLSRGIKNKYALYSDLQPVIDLVVNNFDSASDYVKDIISYIQDTRKQFVEKDITGATGDELKSGKYKEAGSLEELITYAFTDSEFAKFLDNIPASNKIKIKGNTIFEQLKNIVRDIISSMVKSPTALDEINSVLDTYFDTSWHESDIAERNRVYNWGLKFKADDSFFDKYENNPEIISNEYHKAKTDGSNPELVKAVEDLLSGEKPKKETKEQAKLTPEQIEQNIISQEGKVEDEKINELIDKAKTYEPTGTETETVGTEATPTGEISSRPASAFEFLKSESEDVRRDFDEWRREKYKSDNEFRREYEREHLSEFGESEEEFIHRKYREKVCP